MKKIEVIKNYTYNLTTSSTAHGIPNIIKSKRVFHKIMWSLFTLVSTGVCGWFIFKSILNYNENSIFTNIQTLYEQPTIFPTVSICSYNDYLFRSTDFKNLIGRCIFNYAEDCKHHLENYFEPFEDEYGLCYRFNSGKNISGHNVALLRSNVGGMDDSLLIDIINNDGLVIWVHNASMPPKRQKNNNHNRNIKFALSGTWTHLVVDRIIEKKLDYPYNNCYNDINEFNLNKTLIYYLTSKGEIYEQVNCLEICFDLDYINNNPCNCTSQIGKVWDDCFLSTNNESIHYCTLDYKREFYKYELVEKCSSYCPLECNSYSLSVSVESISQGWSSGTTLMIYYRTLKYTLITQEPKMALSDLVSEIGGILGLFIGISFLSLIELFEFIAEIIFILFERNHKETHLIKINNHVVSYNFYYDFCYIEI